MNIVSSTFFGILMLPCRQDFLAGDFLPRQPDFVLQDANAMTLESVSSASVSASDLMEVEEDEE